MADLSTTLDDILTRWADGIRSHQPELVASYFTEDAVFQGFDREHAVGRAAVAAYYEKQPVGLSPEYRVREIRHVGDEAFIAFIDVDFVRPDGEVIPTHLTLALVRAGDGWGILQYHVSKTAA